MSNFHAPVLLEEVIKGLEVKEGGTYIDATIGGGGHGIEILKLGGKVLGIDQDPEALEYANENIKYQISNIKKEEKRKNWKLIRGNFRNVEKIAKENDFSEVDGILFDLGVSSYQLDTPQRGFSYRYDGPLDLRFDQSQTVTAGDIVNRSSEDQLYEIFARFGEEQLARPLAHAIALSRRMKPILTTGDLVTVMSGLVRDKNQLSATLSRVFQSLRIAVNDELTALKEGLKGAERLLKPGGRLAVISFHSLEDRVVKQAMQGASWQVVTKHPILASDSEVVRNSRARSAKLRIATKI
ncbi:16S rRNA (cytosine(1402)-N(4))-methyltransferase RsmH [Candidatus Gottesmanbacteria bacterium]|nr:16S rRNA (cytosine(1402)-N(4))-methyltransferase RsmH [Candidatus Gottesmanbacteria bacterium]